MCSDVEALLLYIWVSPIKCVICFHFFCLKTNPPAGQPEHVHHFLPLQSFITTKQTARICQNAD